MVYERQRTVPQLRIIPFDKPEDQYVVQVHCKFKIAVNVTVGLDCG